MLLQPPPQDTVGTSPLPTPSLPCPSLLPLGSSSPGVDLCCFPAPCPQKTSLAPPQPCCLPPSCSPQPWPGGPWGMEGTPTPLQSPHRGQHIPSSPPHCCWLCQTEDPKQHHRVRPPVPPRVGHGGGGTPNPAWTPLLQWGRHIWEAPLGPGATTAVSPVSHPSPVPGAVLVGSLRARGATAARSRSARSPRAADPLHKLQKVLGPREQLV